MYRVQSKGEEWETPYAFMRYSVCYLRTADILLLDDQDGFQCIHHHIDMHATEEGKEDLSL